MPIPFDSDPDKLTRPELVELVRSQAEMIKALLRRLEKLENEVRESKRAKAPFSKGKRKPNPKKPGRKKGKGTFSRRQPPVPKPEDKVIDRKVILESNQCSHCEGQLEIKTELATTVDMPPQIPLWITRFHVETGICTCCGKTTRATHEDLPADQYGATAHRVGPRFLSHGLTLHYHYGVPQRKVPAILHSLTGISITQSALNQAGSAFCAPNAPGDEAYQQLRREIQNAPVVNTDDTGWRINGSQAFLMGFFTRATAFFQIRWRHRHQEVIEAIGGSFQGLLGTDRGTSYEARALEYIEQQKCLSHLLKNLSEVEITKKGPARVFARDMKKALRAGLTLWHDYRENRCSWEEFRERGDEIRKRLDWLLRKREFRDVDNQRLLNGIGLQHDRGRVLLFLEKPEIEPTNNRAERGLRGAVIARKVSHCSKTERGAKSYERMKSITATLSLRGHNVAEALASMLRGEGLSDAMCR